MIINYEKFGAMFGLFYLANEWLAFGDLRLKKIYDEGYNNFASKIINKI